MRHSIITLSRVAALLATTLSAFAGSKIAPDLPQSDPTSQIDVIVQYKTPPTKDELKQLGPYGQIKKQYSVITGVNVTLSIGAIQQIQLDPNVAYITPNRTSTGAVDISTGAVNAPLVWSYGYDGSNVGVVVIDSGITLKNDLMAANGRSRVVYSQDFVGGDGSDAYGHGTHVAGIIGGNATSSTGPMFKRTFKGMAPNVSLIDFRVLDKNGSGTESNIIAAISTGDCTQEHVQHSCNQSLARPPDLRKLQTRSTLSGR